MGWLLALAAKSFLIAGGALVLLKILERRSAADRSWIAHLALAGLLLLPVAAVALPTLNVVGPEFLVGKAEVESPSSPVARQLAPAPVRSTEAVAPDDDAGVGSAPINWPFWGYAIPAALLLLLTLVALGRLFLLKARATVLVDAPWLTALARAQKRMGFKHGTALLTSDELPSPISWGVVRPVILLNSEAAESHAEAEAIITHELAHVARLDWAKLLLSRAAVALFWFNPLVWLLAREAHQLREEAADDAVLATDIDGAEYASLLVGVARHECRGLLIGAHGVAPGRNSLARRVKRVLDGAAKRASGGWRWGSAAAFFAAGMAVPVAALNLVQATPATASPEVLGAIPAQARVSGTPSGAVSAAVQSAVSARIGDGTGNTIVQHGAETVLRSVDGSSITVSAPDPEGRRGAVLRSNDGKVLRIADARAVPGLAAALAAPSAHERPGRTPLDRAIEAKAVGVTPEYVAAIRSVAPQLALSEDDIVGMKAVGVTPEFVQELARLGYRSVSADDITGAYAVGVRPDYVRALAAAGYGRISLGEVTQLKAVGVTPEDIQRYRQAGYSHLDVDTLAQLKALGVTPEEVKASERYGP